MRHDAGEQLERVGRVRWGLTDNTNLLKLAVVWRQPWLIGFGIAELRRN